MKDLKIEKLTCGLFFGFLTAVVSPLPAPNDWNWRIQGGIPIVINIVQLVGLFLIVKLDSPRWYHNYAHDKEKVYPDLNLCW